jgi:lysophospholipase L1-like esterase
MHADVEWSSVGIVGGTVADIRGKLLPELKKKLDTGGKGGSDQDTEVLIVVICGLNDFKQLMEKFPHGPGPTVFKEELGKLVKDIKAMGEESALNLKLFLPSIPIVVGRGDPTCHIMVRPLDSVVEYIAYIWDLQKKAIAFDDNNQSITYIGNPTPDKHYATPGQGNFSSDGIHPSQQGYRWWGYHIAECILASNLDEFVVRALPETGKVAAAAVARATAIIGATSAS